MSLTSHQTESGFTQIPNEITEYIYGGDLSKPAIKLLIMLWRYKNTDVTNELCGLAWPSSDRMKQELSISASDIKPAREELISKGLIKIHRGVRGKLYYHFNTDASTYKEIKTKSISRVTEVSDSTVTEMSDTTVTEVSEQRILSYNDYIKNTDSTPTALKPNSLVDFDDLFDAVPFVIGS